MLSALNIDMRATSKHVHNLPIGLAFSINAFSPTSLVPSLALSIVAQLVTIVSTISKTVIKRGFIVGALEFAVVLAEQIALRLALSCFQDQVGSVATYQHVSDDSLRSRSHIFYP